VGVSWPFGIYRLLSAPGRNSLKLKRSPFAVYLHLSLPSGWFDGKSDGKISLRVLFRIFTVKPTRGTRETLQIAELLPLWIVELGKSLSFPSTANPEASDRSKSLSPNFHGGKDPTECVPIHWEVSGEIHRILPQPRADAGVSLMERLDSSSRLCAR
jgi:hypothetical protein